MAEIKGADLLAKEPQGAGRRVHVRRRRVSRRADRRCGAESGPALYRHAQRAGGLLCRGRRRLPDRPARLVHRRHRPRRHPRPRRPCQRPAELLADDPDRRRLGDLPQRHGLVPGRAPGAGRDPGFQMGARDRARQPHPVLCRDGGAAVDLRPPRRDLSRLPRRHDHRLVRHGRGGRGRRNVPTRRARWRCRRTSSMPSTCCNRRSARWS